MNKSTILLSIIFAVGASATTVTTCHTNEDKRGFTAKSVIKSTDKLPHDIVQYSLRGQRSHHATLCSAPQACKRGHNTRLSDGEKLSLEAVLNCIVVVVSKPKPGSNSTGI